VEEEQDRALDELVREHEQRKAERIYRQRLLGSGKRWATFVTAAILFVTTLWDTIEKVWRWFSTHLK
jgi:fructose-bisphosphate aldolase class 1